MRPRKEISFLHWIIDLLPEEVVNKAFFGGRAFYLNEKIILAVFENPGDRQYKDFIADFDIWCGCLFPVDFEKQSEVLSRFPELVVHPVLRKWLYLPQSHDDFEVISSKIIKQIARGSELFGTIPNQKKNKKSGTDQTKKLSKKMKTLQIEKVSPKEMRRPRIFSEDENQPVNLKIVKAISDLKNLGPMSEKHFHQAGIKTAQQFMKLGWKKTLEKLVKSNKKHRNTLYAYALIGASKNQIWSRISDEDKKEARNFVKKLKK